MFGRGRSSPVVTTAFVNVHVLFKADLSSHHGKEEVQVEVEDGNLLVVSGHRLKGGKRSVQQLHPEVPVRLPIMLWWANL